MSRKIILVLISALSLNLSFGQNYKQGDTLIVNAISGLNLRENPNINSPVKGLIDYGGKVTIDSLESIPDTLNFRKLKGNWIEVKTSETSGFVFDAYLTTLPVIDLEAPAKDLNFGIALKNDLQKYIEKIGVTDTSRYYSGFPGERYQKISIYELDQGHQYFVNEKFAGFSGELQFKGIRYIEGINFIRSILMKYGKLDKLLEEKLKTFEYYQSINTFEVCCYIELHKFEDIFSIKFNVGLR